MLQTTNEQVIIVPKDLTTADTTAQMSSSQFAVTDADTVIDGSTSSAQADTTAQVNNIPVNGGSSVNPSSVIGSNYLEISMLVLFLFALIL